MEPSRVAQLIRINLDRLIEYWTREVREDPRIRSDAELNKPELVDHVPALVGEICALLDKGEVPSVRNTIEARANVYTRVIQGYKGRDLVRELSLLRLILIDYVDSVHDDPSRGVERAERQSAVRMINLYIDEEMRHAIAVYTDLSVQKGREQIPEPAA